MEKVEGLYYRIVREDKGFDSGVKPLVSRITEDLPLIKDAYNYFKFTILDSKNNIVDGDIELIGISHGMINPGETPIAHDICVELDDDGELVNAGKSKTRLEPVFLKNTFLPHKKSLIRYLNKTILKGSDDGIVLNILEGPLNNIPQANESIAFLEIKGIALPSDVYKGDEIEIKIEMSASREIKASVYFPRINKEFSGVYNGTNADLPVSKFKEEIEFLHENLEIEIKEAIEREEYETADHLSSLQKKVNELVDISDKMPDDDSTDARHKAISKKRKLAQEIDDATKNKRIELIKIEYSKDKDWCQEIVTANGSDSDRKMFKDIVNREQIFLNGTSMVKIKEAIDDLNNLGFNILWKTPEFLEAKFKQLIAKPQLFNDQSQGNSLTEAGHLAISNKNYDRLRQVNFDLIGLMPNNSSINSHNDKEGRIGFF